MKALSIRQPWAWLIVNGHKDIENRTWISKYRGDFLVHTGKAFDHNGYAYVSVAFPDIIMPLASALQLGGIVGKVTMTDCVKDHDSRWKDPDCYGFVLTNPKTIPFKPLNGQLNFFNVDDDIMNAISIPKRKKDETECPLPSIYQKACIKIMHPDGWSCEDKCWRSINSAMISLGSLTFSVDEKVKEFDYATIEPHNQALTKTPPKSDKPPKKSLFTDW